MSIFSVIFVPFAWLLRTFYSLFHSYGLAIIFFCLITKIILFPLSLKGKKSMIRMNALSAKQQQLQKQYGKDKDRLNAELQKLYERENVNPMGGCLWSLLPLPILIGLYGVIQKPLTYLMKLSSDQVNELSNFLFNEVLSAARTGEITIAEALFNRFDDVVANLPAMADKLFRLDFSFLGINLAQTPQWNPTQFDGFTWNNIGLFLIPVISAVLAFFSMQISNKTNKTANNKDNPIANNKTMLLTMPLISLWIGFTLPASLGLYWIANNVFTMLQELVAAKLLKGDFEAAAREQEERERREKEEEKEKKRLAAETKAKAAAEGKKKQLERKASGEVLAHSRIGIRAYARGRNYDPDRYGGVTPYRDPSAPIDEAAVEAARKEKEEQARQEEVPTPPTEELAASQVTELPAAPEEGGLVQSEEEAQAETKPDEQGYEAEAAPEAEDEDEGK